MSANFGHEFSSNIINNLPIIEQQLQQQQQKSTNFQDRNMNSEDSASMIHHYTGNLQQNRPEIQPEIQQEIQPDIQTVQFSRQTLQHNYKQLLNSQPLASAPAKKRKKILQPDKNISYGNYKFQCDVCDFKTNVKYSYNSHLKLHQDAVYECLFCDKKFKQHQGLTHHMKRIHRLKSLRPRGRPKQNGTPDGRSGIILDDPGYKCLDCDFSSNSVTLIRNHLENPPCRNIHKVVKNEQPTECEKCGERFKTAQSLDYHKAHVCVRTENHETIITCQTFPRLHFSMCFTNFCRICSYCGLRLKTVDRFNIHQQIGCIIIPEDELENGMCSSCPVGREFKLNMELDRVDRWNLLAMHKRVCPEASTVTSCSLCGRTFGDEKKLH